MLTAHLYITHVAHTVRAILGERNIHPNNSPLLTRLEDPLTPPSAPLPYSLHKEGAQLGIVFFLGADGLRATVTEPGAMHLSQDAFRIQRRDAFRQVIRRWPPGEKLTVQATLHTPRFETIRRILQQFPNLVVRIDAHGMTLLHLDQYPVQDTIHCTQCNRMLPVECFPGSKRGVDESICSACVSVPGRTHRPRTTTSARPPRVSPEVAAEAAACAVVEPESGIASKPDTDLWHEPEILEPQLAAACFQTLVAEGDTLYNRMHKSLRMVILGSYRRITWLWWKLCGRNAN